MTKPAGLHGATHRDRDDEIAEKGRKAWQRVKSGKLWKDWLEVGDALLIGRRWAMNQAGTNQPQGKAYSAAFNEWLHRYMMDDMDKATRARLLEVMENVEMITEWRDTQPRNKQLELNHPAVVLRNWKRAMEPVDPEKESKPTLRDSVANLSEANDVKDREIAGLKAHIEDLQASHDSVVTELEVRKCCPKCGHQF